MELLIPSVTLVVTRCMKKLSKRLSATNDQKNPKWLVDIQPESRGGKRYRKTLPTTNEALR